MNCEHLTTVVTIVGPVTASYGRSDRDDGWIVTVRSERTYYADSGGAWRLNSDGKLGRQLAGRLDVRAPRDLAAMRRFVRAGLR